jgi:hypothetical protein
MPKTPHPWLTLVDGEKERRVYAARRTPTRGARTLSGCSVKTEEADSGICLEFLERCEASDLEHTAEELGVLPRWRRGGSNSLGYDLATARKRLSNPRVTRPQTRQYYTELVSQLEAEIARAVEAENSHIARPRSVTLYGGDWKFEEHGVWFREDISRSNGERSLEIAGFAENEMLICIRVPGADIEAQDLAVELARYVADRGKVVDADNTEPPLAITR